jgi:SAM-dependent methyltransferase
MASLIYLYMVTTFSLIVHLQATDLCENLLQKYFDIREGTSCPGGSFPAETDFHLHEMIFNNCPLPGHRSCQVVPPSNYSKVRRGDVLHPQRFLPKGQWSTIDQLANRGAGHDCKRCWKTEYAEVQQKYIEEIEAALNRKVDGNLFSTGLDVCGGTGALAELLAMRGIQMMMFARDWNNLPYVETAASRGVLTVIADFRKAIPVPNFSIDLLIVNWCLNIFAEANQLTKAIYEFDRVLRPGGVIIQSGWTAEKKVFNRGVEALKRAATNIGWDLLKWEVKVDDSILGWSLLGSKSYLDFICRKKAT